ncbi:hypothetical protein ABT063_00765 [Streptomyces sp. NPDC002838]|uniref:hypothetical protein n=1 Tax=Streptomyces sp. NPDC002838 TaxID=3154436 RepID=UPI0033272626
MSADRKANHDMTNSDIALLLADAADEVEIGIAPYQAVIRGGRRRRARRWALAAATALVLAGSSATLAVAGLPGGDGGRKGAVATQPPVTVSPNVFEAKWTRLADGAENGKTWEVLVDVWPAPRDEGEAQAELDAMHEYGYKLAEANQASQLVGKGAFFVHHSDGDKGSMALQGLFSGDDTMSRADIESAAMPLKIDSDDPQRLVIGKVAKTVQQITCTWKNGTTTEVTKPPPNEEVSTDIPAIRTVEGSPVNWFVCLAPKGTEYESVKVTK